MTETGGRSSWIEAGRHRTGAAARILLVQALVVGAAASLALFLTTGVNPRSVGFGVLALAAAAVLPFTCQGRGTDGPPSGQQTERR